MKKIVALKFSDGTEEWVSPQRLLEVFNEYRIDAVAQILARTQNHLNEVEIAAMIRDVRYAAKVARRAAQRDKARKPRKAATKAISAAAVHAFKARYEADNGTLRGWRKAAAREWPEVSAATLSVLARPAEK